MACRVFELMVPAPTDTGLEDTWIELINFLTVTIVKPNDNRVEHYILQDQSGKARYAPGPEDTSYLREGILYRDLRELKITSAPTPIGKRSGPTGDWPWHEGHGGRGRGQSQAT
jgi:hypothetical protein